MRIEDLEEIPIPEQPKAMMAVSLEAKQIIKENPTHTGFYYWILPIAVFLILCIWYYFRSHNKVNTF